MTIEEHFQDIIWNQIYLGLGYLPPYTLTISDGEGQSISYNVTMTFVPKEPNHEVREASDHDAAD